MKLYPKRLNRDFHGTDENTKIQDAYEKMLKEEADKKKKKEKEV
jgi:hypothetical protein